jgi:O-Antigen ligase
MEHFRHRLYAMVSECVLIEGNVVERRKLVSATREQPFEICNPTAGGSQYTMALTGELPSSANDTEIYKMDFWTILAGFLLLGYSLFGRSFAYVGIAPAKIFIGDVALAAFILFRSRSVFDRWLMALMHRDPLSRLAWTMLLFLLYGVFEVAHGILAGYDTLIAFQNLVFNVYPLYFFFGLYVGTRRPNLLLQVMRILAWANSIYGLAYILVLNKIQTPIPGSGDVPIFAQAAGGSGIILALMALDPKPSRYWLPLSINAFLLLAMQIRGEWVGFLVSLLIWGLLSRKLDRVLISLALISGLLAIGYLADFSIPAPAGRGGNISTRDIVGRAVASVDADAASEYTRGARTFAGTVSWRTQWWHAIWDSVHEEPSTTFFGQGYGFPLGELVPYLRTAVIRTPHNVFFYALGYTGWIGVSLFFAFQFALLQLLWRTYRVTGQAFGVAAWAGTLLSAFFGNSFETPFGAIPTYLSFGLLIAPGLLERSAPREQDRLVPQLIEASGCEDLCAQD